MKAMGCCGEMRWEDFSKRFIECENISGRNAVEIIRRIFGEDRLMLIEVDEVMKSRDYDQTVITQLGEILDWDGRTDVLVTSLSPAYIRTLVTQTSQRSLNYIPLRPLPVDQLGMAQYTPLAEQLIRRVEAGEDDGIERVDSSAVAGESSSVLPVDLFCKRMLLSAPIIASGHGRTVEKLLYMIETEPNVWKALGEKMKSNNAMELLSAIVNLQCFKEMNRPDTAEDRHQPSGRMSRMSVFERYWNPTEASSMIRTVQLVNIDWGQVFLGSLGLLSTWKELPMKLS